MQKKVILTLSIALTLLISPLSPIYAASPSPSSSPLTSPSPASINEVTENLKKRLQETVDSTVSTPEISKARGYIGIVKDMIKDTVVIEDKDGKKDILITDETTIVRSPENTTIKSDSIRIDDYIIAIGYPGDGEVLTGRRLIVSATPIKPPAKKSGIGTVVKIAKSELVLKIDGSDVAIAYTSKTTFKSAAGSIELADLEIGDTLIYAAISDAKDNLTSTLIMRIGSTSL